MFLLTSSLIALLFLQIASPQRQQTNDDDRTVDDVAAPEVKLPARLVFKNKDWNLTQAYLDVFNILSSKNRCSDFYGGPRAATTVLNDFFANVTPKLMVREISFKMDGKPRLIRDFPTGVLYRLFDHAVVNSNGAFYQRRSDPLRKFPSDVGSFFAGSRPARALILLHELAHLIRGENGTWLIPDDGYGGNQSKANTLLIEGVCRAELKTLK